MIKIFTSVFVFFLVAMSGLSAQMFDFPAGCLDPAANVADVNQPKVFGAAELDGTPLTAGSIIYVFNADGGLIGKTATFPQNDPLTMTNFQAFLAAINTDPQGANNCPVYTEGEEVTVVFENAGSSNLQAQNSTFVGEVSTGGLLTGPNGMVTVVDTFNFETRFLPVTFANLSARDLGGKVIINWSTASESGNEYFEVEHATTSGNFASVGEVAGAGDSQELINYDLVHDTPVVGTNFYRIKQVDFEGTYSYSGIIPVEVATVQSEAVTLFPNPSATGYFNLNVGSDWQVDNVSVSVLNAVGRRVMEWNQDVTATRQVMTTDLAAGIYLVRVEGGKRTSTKRLVIR